MEVDAKAESSEEDDDDDEEESDDDEPGSESWKYFSSCVYLRF